jgi:hypothetical protein
VRDFPRPQLGLKGLMLLSLNKIVMLIAILAAVWYGFRLIGRLKGAQRTKPRRGFGFGFGKPRNGGRDAEPEIVDLVRSADGKTYTARKTDEHS